MDNAVSPYEEFKQIVLPSYSTLYKPHHPHRNSTHPVVQLTTQIQLHQTTYTTVIAQLYL